MPEKTYKVAKDKVGGKVQAWIEQVQPPVRRVIVAPNDDGTTCNVTIIT